VTRRISVGFVSPLPPTRSGVADYAAELLKPLGELVEAVPYQPPQAETAFVAGHDVLLVQIGNDPIHAPSVEALARPRGAPAVVVLHDFVLHHLFAAAYRDQGRVDDYEKELVRSEGERGRLLVEEMRRGAVRPVWDLAPWEYPMSAAVIRDAAAVVAHSRVVRGAVLRQNPGACVFEIPHHVVPAARTERPEACRSLGLPPDRPIAVTLGRLTPAKRVGKILQALGRLPQGRRPFLFVGGAASEDDSLIGAVRSLDLGGDVAFGGWLSESDFWRAASAATVAVNLRHPTMGETSGAVCRMAGFGLPLIVSDTGWFRELPSDFASKVPVGGDEVERLAGELERVAFDPAEARRRSEAAAAWGRERSPERVARLCADALADVVAGWAGPLGLKGRLAQALMETGVASGGASRSLDREPDASLVAAAAARASGLLPARS